MEDNFTPQSMPLAREAIALPPESELQALSTITEADVEQAIEVWNDNPPDTDFAGILEAETE